MIVLKDLEVASAIVSWPELEENVYMGDSVTQERRQASRESRGSGTWYSTTCEVLPIAIIAYTQDMKPMQQTQRSGQGS